MRLDIFCHVIDNLGDAGVALRLTRRLALSHFTSQDHFTSSDKDILRLFCDQPDLIRKIAGEETLRELFTHGVEILPWEAAKHSVTPEIYPAVIIETFSCTLPAEYIAQVRAMHSPLVINVEYLSAEPWTLESHRLPSLPSQTEELKRYFYYPGFLPQSGGLLQGKLSTVDDTRSALPNSLLSTWQHLRPNSQAKKVAIFTYGGEKLERLLTQMLASNQALDLLFCDAAAITTAQDWLGESLQNVVHRQALQCIAVPFIPQDDFDWLLTQCDLNCVRGEDSFVRAQWAGKPFIWDIYPQQVDAHLQKLAAFLDLYIKNASPTAQRGILEAMHWQDFSQWWPALHAMSQHAIMWRAELVKAQKDGDLAIRLRDFILEKIKKG